MKNHKRSDLFQAISRYDLWSFLAWQDIKIKYRRSKIGPFWITLSMAIFCLTLGVVYSRLFKIEISELLPYISIGVVVWNYIASVIGEMSNLFVDNASYMKDMRINPLVVLLRVTMRNTIIFGHNLLILLGIYCYFRIWPGYIGLLALPGLVLVILNLIVVSISLSIIGARFRDLAQIVQSILQVIFFVTPIFWFPRLLSKESWIVKLNPVAYYIDLVRTPLLGHPPEMNSWLMSLLTLFVMSIFAVYLYRTKSARIAFWV